MWRATRSPWATFRSAFSATGSTPWCRTARRCRISSAGTRRWPRARRFRTTSCRCRWIEGWLVEPLRHGAELVASLDEQPVALRAEFAGIGGTGHPDRTATRAGERAVRGPHRPVARPDPDVEIIRHQIRQDRLELDA